MLINIICLSIILKENNKIINKIIQVCDEKEISEILNGNKIYIKLINDLLNEKQLSSLEDKAFLNKIMLEANKIILKCQELGISILLSNDTRYPSSLKQLEDYPPILYYMGEVSLLNINQKKVAIIGTRTISAHGKIEANRITSEFVKEGFVIVSGLAAGTDSIAHKTCLSSKGKTIAVVASGLDRTYPTQNKCLQKDILNNSGLIISEYPPGWDPKKHRFVKRNRIVSCISDGIIVIETSEKSGTMRTVEYALEQSKNIALAPVKEPQQIYTSVVLSKLYQENIILNNIYDCCKFINLIGYSSKNREFELSNLINKLNFGHSLKNLILSEKIEDKIVESLNEESIIFKKIKNLTQESHIDVLDLINTLMYMIIKGVEEFEGD